MANFVGNDIVENTLGHQNDIVVGWEIGYRTSFVLSRIRGRRVAVDVNVDGIVLPVIEPSTSSR